jgi:hypothetical protein
MDVSRDNIAGFLLGISVGVAVGIVLKLSDHSRQKESEEVGTTQQFGAKRVK